jgi:hypothetical protein
MSQYLVSVIRTWVPIIVGWLVSQLLVIGVVLDEDTSKLLESAISALTIALYYAAARWLETKFPNAGILLGYIRQPVYVDPNKTPTEQKNKLSMAVKNAAKDPTPSRE